MGCVISTCSVCFSLTGYRRILQPEAAGYRWWAVAGAERAAAAAAATQTQKLRLASVGSRGPGTLRGLSMATPAPPQRRSGTQAPQSRCHIRNSLPKRRRGPKLGHFITGASPYPSKICANRAADSSPRSCFLFTRSGAASSGLVCRGTAPGLPFAKRELLQRVVDCPAVVQPSYSSRACTRVTRVVQESCACGNLYDSTSCTSRSVESCKGLGSVAEINDRWPRLRKTILRLVKIYLTQKNFKRVRLEEQPLRQVT